MNHDPLHDLFERAAPPAASPAHTRQALDGLRPGFEGALRRQRLRLGAAVTAATFALAGGAAALGAIGTDSDAELDPVSPSPATSIGDAEIVEDSRNVPGDPDATSEAPGAGDSRTETVEPAPTSVPVAPVDDDTDEPDDGTPGSDDSEATEPDDDHDESPTSTTLAPTTTVAPPSDSLTGTTPGGSVTVTFDNGFITIESIEEEPGFTSDVTEEDPQEFKVYFYGNGAEYEIEIKVENGELVIDDEQSDS